jgi:chemotaxis protein CheD
MLTDVRKPVMPLSNHIRVDVGDLHASANTNQTILTYALGSCIGLVIYDSKVKVGGLAHIQLPHSLSGSVRESEGLWAFADKAVPELFQRVYALGANKRSLRIVLTGGASVLDPENFFQIGRKNYLAVKKLLWQSGYIISAEAVGGADWRTVRLEVSTGRVEVQTNRGREVL